MFIYLFIWPLQVFDLTHAHTTRLWPAEQTDLDADIGFITEHETTKQRVKMWL